MKKLLLSCFFILFSLPVFAEANLEPLLDKVSLQLQAEQWVTTKTALVNVSVNAAVTDQGIEKIQVEAMQKLNQLSDKSEWHIVSFDRQEDRSGLESIQIVAQARLPQSDLANLRNKAKDISKPGVTFTIDSVQFVPSETEIREANQNLRNNLYQQARAEIEALNKVYTDQKYYLHQIDFLAAVPSPMPVPQNMMAMKVASQPSPLTVGNKIQMQATVVLASMPSLVAQKLARF
jgi:hypothetical protein